MDIDTGVQVRGGPDLLAKTMSHLPHGLCYAFRWLRDRAPPVLLCMHTMPERDRDGHQVGDAIAMLCLDAADPIWCLSPPGRSYACPGLPTRRPLVPFAVFAPCGRANDGLARGLLLLLFC